METKLAALHQVVFQVGFSLLLAILGPLEGSAVKKCAECRFSTLIGCHGLANDGITFE